VDNALASATGQDAIAVPEPRFALPATPAQDHRIHLFYEFRCDPVGAEASLPRVTLAEVTLLGWVHPERAAQNSIWEWAQWDVSPSLHPFVRGVLNSFGGEPVPPEPLCLCLSAEGLNLLRGRYRRPSPRSADEGRMAAGRDGLVLALPRQHDLPEEVLAQAPWVVLDPARPDTVGASVQLDHVRLHLFRTGIGLIVVTMRIAAHATGAAPLAAGALVSALPLLTHERRQPCLGWTDTWSDPRARFHPRPALAAMIAPAGCTAGQWDRSYSYCAVVWEQPIAADTAREIAFRLSRHYSMRYRPGPGMQGTEFVAPFENVVHALSREGACTLINGTADAAGTTAELLATWTTQAHPQVYLPLQVAAVHELVALLDMAQDASRRIPADPRAPLATGPLRELCSRVLAFRLHYRFAQVSSITMHDLFFEAASRALGLRDISEKINRDLTAIERRLVEEERDEAEIARRRRLDADKRAREDIERRHATWAGLSSAGLAYLTISAVAASLIRFVPTLASGEWTRELAAETVGQLLAFAAAIFGYRYATRHQRYGMSEAEHIEAHQRVELAVAASEEPRPQE